MTNDDEAKPHDRLLDDPDLAEALQNERFKQFLDHVPVAVAVSELQPDERIAYTNLEFERITGQAGADLKAKPWSAVRAIAAAAGQDRRLCDAIAADEDYLGEFEIDHGGRLQVVDAWSNVIYDEMGQPSFRLVAVAETNCREGEANVHEQRVQEQIALLRELQHRVKNNLQMITALIRLEARNLKDDATSARFARLAGRVDALGLLYRLLSQDELQSGVDLGTYLSQIASAVMQAHAVEGIRLDLKVDSWPVSVNVAMPTGLVVNELLTNALKHAFPDREGGTIGLHSLIDETGCRVTVADDGVGLPDGVEWPSQGKLGALIVQSLRQNARATFEIASSREGGVRATISFPKAGAEPARK